MREKDNELRQLKLQVEHMVGEMQQATEHHQRQAATFHQELADEETVPCVQNLVMFHPIVTMIPGSDPTKSCYSYNPHFGSPIARIGTWGTLLMESRANHRFLDSPTTP